CARDQSNLDLW
nr:immunoglobulin heavy chain junction region [Macaca mulatta]